MASEMEKPQSNETHQFSIKLKKTYMANGKREIGVGGLVCSLSRTTVLVKKM